MNVRVRLKTGGKIELQVLDLSPIGCMIDKRGWSAQVDERVLLQFDGLGFQPGRVLWVEGDLTRLAQVVGNLVNNAAKYTAPGGRIRVGSRRRGDRVEIHVTDNGAGIDAAEQPRVFDLFMQVEGTRRHSQGGLGVGLALVRRLVELHGGSVTVQSEGAGHGSTFIVSLPQAAAFGREAPLASLTPGVVPTAMGRSEVDGAPVIGRSRNTAPAARQATVVSGPAVGGGGH